MYVYRLEGQIPQVLRVFSDAVSGGLSLRGAVESAAALALRPMGDVLRRVLSLAEVGGGLEGGCGGWLGRHPRLTLGGLRLL